MSRSSQRKETYESIEISENHSNEGTSARTRPFNFDDIMLRRKAKKLAENESHGTLCQTLEDGNLVKVSDCHGSKRVNGHNEDSSVHIPHSSVEDHGKEKSRKKGRDLSFKADHSAKDRGDHHFVSMSDAKSYQDSRDEYRERDCEKIVSVGKREEWHGNGSRDGHTKKNPRVIVEKDGHMDGDRHRDIEKSVREYRGKYYNRVEEKMRERSMFKDQSFGKGHNLQKSEGRERRESSKVYHEELRPKRRRSRSQEHNDQSRKAISRSPRSHKHASNHGRGCGELPLQMLEGKSGREQSNTNWSRLTKNGSNNDYKKHGVSTSGLGGYSPRKRRTAAVAKTPSPTKRSPQKRRAKWDVAPEVTAGTSAVSMISDFYVSNKSTNSNIHEVVSSIDGASSYVNPVSVVLSHALSMNKSASIDSIHLTQATRPMRRLYLENLPASTSEKAVMEWLNNLLISSGVNHVKGTQPCINCIIHKEKSQALVELLTPEDAVAACSFNGFLFSGSIINVRRPKDFVEVATGEAEKSVDVIDAISDTVVDSPNKIFIGGISQDISPKMLMEIASAFGSLKAFQFEKNHGQDKPHAFIEYVDESVTLKACAGLNGMKLGRQVITAVQAIPSSLLLETGGDPQIRGIPGHAKPLLEKAMPVLMLRNVFMPEALPCLSSSEIEEVLEDVRLECARFGTVRSVNLVEHGVNAISIKEPCEMKEDQISIGTQQNQVSSAMDTKVGTLKENAKSVESSSACEDESEGNGLDEPFQQNECDVTEGPFQHHECDGIAVEVAWRSEPCCQQLSTLGYEVDSKSGNIASNVKEINVEDDSTAEEVPNLDSQRDVITVDVKDINKEMNSKTRETSILEDLGGKSYMEDGVVVEINAVEKGVGQASDIGRIFDPGCVFVEFRRTEASLMAAHCLHGRLFDDRIVTVEYVPPHVYRAMFPK